MEDKEIIEKILNGQNHYFGLLIEKYQKLIYKIFYQSGYFKTQQDVEDLVQDTFLIIFDKLYSYKPEYEFRNWIYTIALNKLRGFIKKEKIKKRISKILHLNFDEEDLRFKEEESIEQQEFFKKINAAVSQLPMQIQRSILLFYGDNLKIKDIAAILNSNENTVKTWLRRGKEALENNPEIKKMIRF